ncbi:MAG: hypothetical protein ACOYXN_05205 [Acidobacteriota bacterium]
MTTLRIQDESYGYPVMLSPGGTVAVLIVSLLLVSGAGLVAWRYQRWLDTPQRFTMTLGERGFSPESLTLDPRRPVELTILRTGGGRCTQGVVLSGAGMRQFFPETGKAVFHWTPRATGRYELRCFMGCLRASVRLTDTSASM